ncbi:MAG: hypothetical protein ABI528_10055, partial [bacterium]
MLKRFSLIAVLSFTILLILSFTTRVINYDHPRIHSEWLNESKSKFPGIIKSPEFLFTGYHSNLNKNNINSDWQEKVFESIEKKQYDISFDNKTKTFNSPNRNNNITFQYNKNGFTAKTLQTKVPLFDVNDAGIFENEKKFKSIEGWSIGLQLLSMNDHSTIFKNDLMVDGNNASVENEMLRIDYANSEKGMRQDFIVKSRPLGNGKLKLDFSADTKLEMTVGADELVFSN